MVTLLESHLSLLEQEAEAHPAPTVAEQGTLLDELVALHTAVYEVMELRIGPDGVSERDRPLVPLFRRWLQTGRRIVAAAGASRRAGRPIARLDDLGFAINRSKLVAEDFDRFVELNRRIAAGELGTYRPLSEVWDELQAQDQSQGRA